MVLLAPMYGAALLEGTGTQQWSRVNNTPQAGRVCGQTYLRDSEAMGLGMGLSFAECFVTGAWLSWEKRGKR